MDVADLYAEIGRLLGDPNNDTWSQAILLERMNLAQTKVLSYTNAVKTRESLTPVAGTATVQLDTDVIDIIRVDIQRADGSWKKLRGYLRDQLDFENPDWQQIDNGKPQCYWWDGTNQQINLVPAPDSANAIASGLRVWEVQKPADMDDSSDVPFGSNTAMIPYHLAIAHWVVAQCFMDTGTPEALAKSKFHRSGLMAAPGCFEIEIKTINAKFDAPEDIPARILWAPEGGRASQAGLGTSKGNPFGQ